MVVIVNPDSQFAAIAHPPIDRWLLQNLAKADVANQEIRAMWRGKNWTKLNKNEYFELIRQFRQYGLDKPRFWDLERYWTAI